MERRDMVLAHWLEFQNGTDENAHIRSFERAWDFSARIRDLSRMAEYAYLGLGVVDQVKRKVTDLEPLEPFLYTTINTIRDWVNGEDVDVSAPVLALIQESTGCGYADFDIIMGTLPRSIILDNLFESETESPTDEH